MAEPSCPGRAGRTHCRHWWGEETSRPSDLPCPVPPVHGSRRPHLGWCCACSASPATVASSGTATAAAHQPPTLAELRAAAGQPLSDAFRARLTEAFTSGAWSAEQNAPAEDHGLAQERPGTVPVASAGRSADRAEPDPEVRALLAEIATPEDGHG